ncbi:hypothetical protein [Flavobacterium microcysteis]|jgi:hypothetical protein|uniref:Peptidyl-prolyl cis-trans isomerase n=1 Tax=Flavobacterium microcysteis TaxID=2596891 RepID=A0A501Q1G5_9FLAO|nr:hypothetical protein [Flavobacterium microcysteis]TPD65791.1 hypothetical protein FJA49_16545 [Flavobacterium microcysteis]
MKKYAVIGLLLLLASCNYFKPEAKPQAIARVNDSYLFKDEIKDLVPPGTSKEDSIVIVRNFIDRWASQKLMMSAAEINLSTDKQAEYNELIRQYKIDLYTKGYLEELVKTTVDTVITEAELKEYYKQNKENFKTDGTLVKLRYINLPKDHPKFQTIKSKFFDYRKSDKKFWDTYGMQFKSFVLNDSVWVEMNQVYRKLPFITPDNRPQYISAGKTIEKQDSLEVYLVKVTNVLDKNQISPYEYIKPTLEQVILNKRKLELIKKIEKDITDDAIKNEKYEIYN